MTRRTRPADRPLRMLLRPRPRIDDPGGAKDRLRDLRGRIDPAACARLETARVERLLLALADHSAYLWQAIRADPKRLLRLLDTPPSVSLDALLAGVAAGDDGLSEPALMRRLRVAKQEAALLVALADLGGVWPLETVLQALSRVADALIGAALAFLLRKAAAAARLALPDASDPQAGCGLAVLGLGKLGGCELNYSSDVDLIVIFDPQAASLARVEEPGVLFVRMVKDLVRILQTRTADGYVLRVDLRLRPDPGASAVAIRLGAAFLYYEAYGQNWERAAMIKARPVAGDRDVAAAFVAGLSPFVWRKYFDYAAIADIQAMKRQIHAVKGHAVIAVAGHDVKLGRGGIREIEFFVQTQQLIFGGKRGTLRGSRTLPMLRQLQRDRWVTRKAVGDLARAYAFLRTIEHRLQMIADEQTHKLPSDAAALARFARFAGFASGARFAVVLTRHLARVVAHYALLFEHAPGLDDAGGSLVFTGVADDPETLLTLGALGFKAPAMVAATVRDWHAGRKPAVRSARARETLTDLVPKLLRTFAETADPDKAATTFDKTLDRMPGAAELFAILASNGALRRLFGDILGSAPRLARAVTSRPHLLDAAIGPLAPALLDEAPATAEASNALPMAASTEVFLDALRDHANEAHFLIGLRLLSGMLDPADAGRAYAALAVAVVRVALAHLRASFEAEHGTVPGSAMAVLAMGKLGSREMTATSDLDLVVLYDFDGSRPESDGPRVLHATQYFARLTQRLVSHLTVATRRGALYAVDMRLRPSGRQGPLATKLDAFAPYQRAEAETWEHMALTRARVVAGDTAFGLRVASVIDGILRDTRRPSRRQDVAAMRALVAHAKPPSSAWDLKHLPGGLIDIEFIAQFCALERWPLERTRSSDKPSLSFQGDRAPDRSQKSAIPVSDAPEGAGAAPAPPHDTATQAMLARAADAGLLGRAEAETLVAAHRLYTGTLQILRFALDEDQDPDGAGEGVKARLAAAAGLPGLAPLRDELAARRQAVSEIFAALLSSG